MSRPAPRTPSSRRRILTSGHVMSSDVREVRRGELRPRHRSATCGRPAERRASPRRVCGAGAHRPAGSAGASGRGRRLGLPAAAVPWPAVARSSFVTRPRAGRRRDRRQVDAEFARTAARRRRSGAPCAGLLHERLRRGGRRGGGHRGAGSGTMAAGGITTAAPKPPQVRAGAPPGRCGRCRRAPRPTAGGAGVDDGDHRTDRHEDQTLP